MADVHNGTGIHLPLLTKLGRGTHRDIQYAQIKFNSIEIAAATFTRFKSFSIKYLPLVNHLAYSLFPTGNIAVKPLIKGT